MLNLFSRTKPEIGLGEFVRLTGRDKATVHRHLVELEANGFLEKHPATRAYRLGPAVLRLSGVREATNPLRAIVRPIVIGLANDVGELAHVSLLQGEVLSSVFHFDPHVHGTQVHFDEAELLPLHATSSGLAVLAFSPPSLIEKIVSKELKPFTPHTITDPQDLRRVVDGVRISGISRFDRVFDEEVTSQGAPIFDASGYAIGAISVAVPTVRANEKKLAAIRTKLEDAARAITRSLGGTAHRKQARDQSLEASK